MPRSPVGHMPDLSEANLGAYAGPGWGICRTFFEFDIHEYGWLEPETDRSSMHYKYLLK